MNDIMKSIVDMGQLVETRELEIKEAKQKISDTLKRLQEEFPETKKKFRWNGSWYQIKNRSGKRFIVDFGETEPGSWRKKTKS